MGMKAFVKQGLDLQRERIPSPAEVGLQGASILQKINLIRIADDCELLLFNAMSYDRRRCF
jgi:hypothetical protein